jgi:hypothetical protein
MMRGYASQQRGEQAPHDARQQRGARRNFGRISLNFGLPAAIDVRLSDMHGTPSGTQSKRAEQ